jgi:hypothetical protein
MVVSTIRSYLQIFHKEPLNLCAPCTFRYSHSFASFNQQPQRNNTTIYFSTIMTISDHSPCAWSRRWSVAVCMSGIVVVLVMVMQHQSSSSSSSASLRLSHRKTQDLGFQGLFGDVFNYPSQSHATNMFPQGSTQAGHVSSSHRTHAFNQTFAPEAQGSSSLLTLKNDPSTAVSTTAKNDTVQDTSSQVLQDASYLLEHGENAIQAAASQANTKNTNSTVNATEAVSSVMNGFGGLFDMMGSIGTTTSTAVSPLSSP